MSYRRFRNYHRHGVCEKNNLHLSKVLNGKRSEDAIIQLDKCIKDRQEVMTKKYNGGDEKHKYNVRRLKTLKKKLHTLKKQCKNPKVNVSYRNGRFKASRKSI